MDKTNRIVKICRRLTEIEDLLALEYQGTQFVDHLRGEYEALLTELTLISIEEATVGVDKEDGVLKLNVDIKPTMSPEREGEWVKSMKGSTQEATKAIKEFGETAGSFRNRTISPATKSKTAGVVEFIKGLKDE